MKVISSEARAQIVADVASSSDHVGNPQGRRDAVYAAALEQIRNAVAVATGSTFYQPVDEPSRRIA